MSTDFSSIDRLVEFGMGMALAQQMVKTMNYTMQNAQVAGVNAMSTGSMPPQQCAQPKTESKWFAAIDQRQAGPMTEAELVRLIRMGKISDNTLVWCEGMSGWMLACDVPQINKLLLLHQNGNNRDQNYISNTI